ncbi:uncharacterized protein [Haliotis asinina]|uniref:uncharacterized protein n=1 Tax=Haliotis asinina TaxID=109174 RepID=UPI003531D877
MAKRAASCLLVLHVFCTDNAAHFSQWYDDSRLGTDASLEYHTTTTHSSWWEAVGEGCGSGRVYIPKSDVLPDDITQKMIPGQYYWLGAIAYSTWKWTDGSPFYKYVGYSTQPLYESDRHLVDGNSASRCSLKCGESDPFGLKGDTCYCDVSDQVQMTWNQTGVPCPGNYDERCGNQDGVSVYRSGEITFDQSDKGMCVYAEVITLGHQTGYYPSRCDISRSAACTNGAVLNGLDSLTDSENTCSGSVCVYHTDNSWDEVNRTCNLVTVTSRTKDYLHDAMTYKFVSQDKYTYWIGLRRGYSKKWLNGSDYLDSAITPYTADKLCLSTTGTSLLHWEDCSSELPTICESASPKTTRSTTSSGLHTTLLSIHTGTSASVTTTPTTMPVLTSQTSFTRDVIQQTTEPFSDKHEQSSNNIGLYYGLSVLGVVVVAVVITLLLVMYRQKRCCFTSVPVEPKANSLPMLSMDNDLYLSTDGQGEQGTVPEPSATANRNYSDDEYDLLDQNNRGCANEETADAVLSYPKDSELTLGYGKPMSHHGGRGAYDHVMKGQNIQDETNDHAGDNGTVPKGDDTYDHAGDNVTVCKGDDTYDHAGDNVTVRKGNDTYDHAGEDSCYYNMR